MAEAEKLLPATVSVIDSAASKGIIHKNNAANEKSALSKNLNAAKAAAAEQAAAAPAQESAPAAEETPAVEAPAEKPKKTRAKKAKDAE